MTTAAVPAVHATGDLIAQLADMSEADVAAYLQRVRDAEALTRVVLREKRRCARRQRDGRAAPLERGGTAP
jgi:hypothetical protein